MKNKIISYLKHCPKIYDILLLIMSAMLNIKGSFAPHVCLNLFKDIVLINDDKLTGIIKTLEEKGDVSFIQIGSNDGKQGDPLYNFISNSSCWKGVLVEPVGFLYDRLKNNYINRPDLNFEKSVISNTKKMTFYYLDESAKENLTDLPYWYSQLNSFDRNHIIRYLGKQIVPFIREEYINSITLNDLMEKYNIKKLDMLHIDTEGHDYQILKQLDLEVLRPLMVLVEYRHLSFWETYKLIMKFKNAYRLLATDSDILLVDYSCSLRPCNLLLSKNSFSCGPENSP